MIVSVVLWVLALVAVGLWLARTVATGSVAARNRATMIRSGVDAVVALALVRALAPPPAWTSWVWLLVTAAVGLGLAFAVRRWPDLPWRSSGSGTGSPRPVIAGSAAYAAVGAVLLVVLA